MSDYCGCVLPHTSLLAARQVLGAGFLVLAVAGAVLTGPVTPERARLAASSTAGQHAFRLFTTDAAFAPAPTRAPASPAARVTISQPMGTVTTAGRSWSWSRWTSGVGPPGTVLHPADPVVERRHPRRTPPCRSRPAVREQHRRRISGSRCWAPGHPRRRVPAYQRRHAARRRRLGQHRHPQGRPGVALTRLPAPRRCRCAYPAATATPTVRSVQAVASRPVDHLPVTSRRCCPAPDARRPALLADDPPWPVPAVRRRRGGLVLTHVAVDAAGLLPRAAVEDELRLGEQVVRRPVGRPRRAARLRLRLHGAGNWPFNTAYAANLTGDAFVTRLTSLREAERFIAAGIPLAASISFSRGQLDGGADQRDGRPPGGDRRLHRAPATSWSTTPLRRATPRSGASTTAGSSSGPGAEVQRHRLRRPRRRAPAARRAGNTSAGEPAASASGAVARRRRPASGR